MNIQNILSNYLKDAYKKMLEEANLPYEEWDPVIKISTKPQFGNYQANGVMSLFKTRPEVGKNPREVAEKILEHVNFKAMVKKSEVAGPGFINIFLSHNWVESAAKKMYKDKYFAIEPLKNDTVVVDYSAPNIAKAMHVGHLRSTIIGDTIVRALEYLGQNVVRANHVGDWGTQFGMLIANLERHETQDVDSSVELSDLEGFYRESKTLYDSDEAFAEKSRNYVVRLQAGDEYCLKLWKELVDITVEHNQRVYDRLNVTLTRKDLMGESIYNDMLPGIVDDLLKREVATIDKGAAVVFLDKFKNKDDEPFGVIIRKKDGGYLYTTTDIAAAKYRYETLGGKRLLYYIDSRQSVHLQHAWTIVRNAGYVPDDVPLEHHAFGVMLGKDGKPFKTRTGGTVSLESLLDEAEERALTLIKEKNPDLSEKEQKEIAEIVGIASVKYADLSKNRLTDYIFDWDSMLSFEGNTAPYLLYAYTRVASIFRKMSMDMNKTINAEITITQREESDLLMHVLQFEEMLKAVVRDGYPHFLCLYLYQLAGHFSRFYEACPITTADDKTRSSRLIIASLSGKILKKGLDLLGIKTLEKM